MQCSTVCIHCMWHWRNDIREGARHGVELDHQLRRGRGNNAKQQTDTAAVRPRENYPSRDCQRQGADAGRRTSHHKGGDVSR